MNTSLADVLPITSGSTDLFFAAGEALGGDVAGQHGEVKFKSERSVTGVYFQSSAGVSVLNREGGTSSSGSVWGAGALILRVRHRLV